MVECERIMIQHVLKILCSLDILTPYPMNISKKHVPLTIYLFICPVWECLGQVGTFSGKATLPFSFLACQKYSELHGPDKKG